VGSEEHQSGIDSITNNVCKGEGKFRIGERFQHHDNRLSLSRQWLLTNGGEKGVNIPAVMSKEGGQSFENGGQEILEMDSTVTYSMLRTRKAGGWVGKKEKERAMETIGKVK